MMKKWIAFLLAGALCLGLAGCGTPLPPEEAADGSEWDGDWVTVGNIIGVDTPEGMEPKENNEALSANGMHYATWAIGEGVPYTNEDGEEAQVYDAQVFLLLSGHESQAEAEDTAGQWHDLAQGQYEVHQTGAETHNGQEFTVISYTFASETNPYVRGASAFGVYRNYAVSVELTCREGFDGDAAQLLGEFLNHCHYALP